MSSQSPSFDTHLRFAAGQILALGRLPSSQPTLNCHVSKLRLVPRLLFQLYLVSIMKHIHIYISVFQLQLPHPRLQHLPHPHPQHLLHPRHQHLNPPQLLPPGVVYNIIVYTGSVPKQGSKAQAYITLYGALSSSSEIHLKSPTLESTVEASK